MVLEIVAANATMVETSAGAASASLLIIIFGVVGIVFSLLKAREVMAVSLKDSDEFYTNLNSNEEGAADVHAVLAKVNEIGDAIKEGANSFLKAEYKYICIFLAVFGGILLVVLGAASPGDDAWGEAFFSLIAFLVGGVTSIICGFIGMRIAVEANSRTSVQAMRGISSAFTTAFKAGSVMGFSLVALALLNLFVLICFFKLYFDDVTKLYEAISSYGLGGSSVALFGRVGGGIYTKAADVGADLVGKVEKNIPEDDPRNPATIADNVGDNVGDIAGMGADLFGSFAEATCAALVISSASGASSLGGNWASAMFPLLVTASGIVVCLLTSFVATNAIVVSSDREVEPSLKRQLLVSTVLETPILFLLAAFFLPSEFSMTFAGSTLDNIKNWHVACCAASGLWSGLAIGYTTEYYTSHSYGPVREVADSCKTGAATNVIYGLALGYLSVIIPIFCIAATIFLSFKLALVYGIAVAALGILSTLPTGLTIDAYGPISDNAGGIAEMSGMGENIRAITDALDAAGNTTAAIGKGFAIGSAALVSLALFGAFTTRVQLIKGASAVDIFDPFVFFGLLIGAMLPYWFSAMTMKSVGRAALAMVEEVRQQFANNPGLLEGTVKPDYARCVAISTESSLREMILPGALVMLSPLLMGFIMGTQALSGMLAGGLVSGVQMAISMSNTGGAWDNAKKYVEGGHMEGHGKGSELHKAAVVGDTIGDPLKDTSGPSLNILMKLMAIISVVFAPAMVSDACHKGSGLLGYYLNGSKEI